MCTNFGSAGIPGTRLKVCVWWITNPVLCNTSRRLGAGAFMLNAWTGLLQFYIVLMLIFSCVFRKQGLD